MQKFTVVVMLILGTLLSACGNQNQDNQDSERPIVTGFDKTGQKVTTRGLFKNEACPMIATEFTDKCLNVGAKIIYPKGCDFLCSENVA